MKHKMWSRLLSMALAVMMIASIVPNSAFAEAASEIVASSQAVAEVVEETEEVTLPEETTGEEPAEQPAGEPNPTAEPVAEPTAEPVTESEQPTAEPTQAPTETAVSSEQPSAEPSAAPEGTQTPEGTEAPEGTAVPSETPAASATPAPSESPVPSETPAPSETPEATEKPVAMNEEEYTVSAETVDGIKVEVTVPAVTLPEGAELKVDRLAEGSEDYNATQKTLEENGVEFDSFAALDIRFELNGEEVEPDHPVQVKITANNVLPEDADPSTVAVQHLKENEDGTVTVENVAVAETVDENTVQADMPAMMAVDPAEEQAGEAQPAEEPGTVTANGSELIAEFTVDRFSRFTVTWENWWYEYELTVQYVDANNVDQEVDVQNAPDGNIDADEIKSLDTYKKYASEAGYEVTDVRVYGYYGNQRASNVSRIQYEDGKLQYKTSSQWKSFLDGDVLKILCYKPVEYTTVDTVDSYGEGVKLYMVNFDSESTAGDMGVKTDYGDGARKTKLVQDTLGADGFPISKTGKSLSQWFDPTKANMIAANHLFLKSEYDSTGYFYYSGSDNFATIMEGEEYQYEDGAMLKDFNVYNQLASPDSNIEKFYFRRGNFLPFNTLSDQGTIINRNLYDYLGNALTSADSRYNEPLYRVNENSVDFYFGMYMTADFVYPKDGKVNNEDMVFEFTGDDDMWVFIDGKLVLDLGGRHDALTGTINFATGEVVEYNSAKPNQQKADTVTSSLWDKLDITKEEYFSKDFAAYTKHTIKMFYMESGAGASNLRIKFNLPTIPDNSLDITKNLQYTNNQELDEYLQKTMTYRFQVLNEDGSLRVKEGDTYDIYSGGKQIGTGTVDKNGIFTLKSGQTARFAGKFAADGAPYIVRELVPDGASGQYGEIVYEVSGKGETATVKDDSGTIEDIDFNGHSTQPISPADGSATVVYTNKVTTDVKEWSMLKITKELTSGQQPVPGDKFKMYVTLNDEPLAVGTQYAVTGQDDPKTVNEAGVIELEAGQSATLPVLADVTFKVTEQALGAAYQFGQYKYNGTIEQSQEKGISGYVSAAGIYEVTVTNDRKKGDVTITKTIVNDAELTEEQLNVIKAGLSFELKNGVNTVDTVSGNQMIWTLDQDDNLIGTYTFYNMENGSYTATESVGNTTPDNVILTVKIDNTELTMSNGVYTSESKTLTAPGSVGFEFENTYKPGNGILRIEKLLQNEDGTVFEGYHGGKDVFSFKITDTDGKTWYMHVNGAGTAVVTGTEAVDEKFIELPAGNYTVSELDNLNYDSAKTKVQVGDAIPEFGTYTTVTISGGETVVTFTNTPKTDPGITDGSGVINSFQKSGDVITITGTPVKNEDSSNDDTVVKKPTVGGN